MNTSATVSVRGMLSTAKCGLVLAVCLMPAGCASIASLLDVPVSESNGERFAREDVDHPHPSGELVSSIIEVDDQRAFARHGQPVDETPRSDVGEDVWGAVRELLRFSPEASPRLDAALQFYSGKQAYFDTIGENAADYLPFVVRQVRQRGLPGELALLPIIESAYDPSARSPRGASGLWQFMSGTGTRFELPQTWWYDGRLDIVASTSAAFEYLQYLNRWFDGDWFLTLAAFNAGEGTVERAIKRNEAAGKATDYWSLDLPTETKLYVPRLLAIAEIVSHPDSYDVSLPDVSNDVSFALVDVPRQIDLALVSELSSTPMDQLVALNPGFKRWASDPDGPHRFLLPKSKKTQFLRALANHPQDNLVTWRRHIVKKNETLSGIASHYHTSVSALKRLNDMNGNLIRVGGTLIVPAAPTGIETIAMSAGDSLEKTTDERSGNKKGKKLNYTIRPGDNLWTIARRHDVRVADLTAWNDINRKSILKPGDTITLWLTPAAPPVVVNGVIPAALKNKKAARITYTVKNGDSLWTISQRFRVAVGDLRRWNGLKHGNLIRPGQQIELYPEQQNSRVES